MRKRWVVFAPEARDDLEALYLEISKAASPRIALAYVERLEAYCLGFELASERGGRRDDIRQGLRIVGFESRVTIAFLVDHDRVTILRMFPGGKDWEGLIG